MRTKRWLASFLTVMLLALPLAGCAADPKPQSTNSPASANDGGSGKVVNIDFWGGWTGPDLNTMEGLVNKFNQEQSSIHVEFTSLQWTPLFTKFLTEMKGGNPPDVLVMHPFELGQFVEMGVLDNGPIAGVGMESGNYSSFAWGGTFYKGEQYAVPLDVHMHGLYYNKELYSEAGVTQPPLTGDELIATAQKLTIDNKGKRADEEGFDENNIVQYGLGFSMNHHVFYQIYALLNQQGHNPFTEDMKAVELDEDKMANAIAFLQDLVFKYKVVPKGEKSPVDDFMGGKVAMFVDGPWQMPKLEDSNIQWATAPYPKVFDKPAAWGAAEILTFPIKKNSDPEKAEAAIEFVKWLDNNSGEWAKSGQLPSSNVGMQTAQSMEGRDAFINSLDSSVLLPSHPKAAQVFSSTAPSPILTAAQDAILNNKDPHDIAKQLKKEMDSLLQE